MSKKILFLDIDGVLNSGDYLSSLTCLRRITAKNKGILFSENKEVETTDKYGQLFDPRCVNWFKYIIAHTGADICITSTWRYAGLQEMKNLFADRNIQCNIVGITPFSGHKLSDELLEKYDNEHDRGLEIHQWLMDNSTNKYIDEKYTSTHMETCVYDKYCIVDDDADIKMDQINNFVRTDFEYGITRDAANRIIEILNS